MENNTQLELFTDEDFGLPTGRMIKKEIAAHYGISQKVLRRWLIKLGMQTPKMGGYYYTPAEVKKIGKELG